MEVTTIFWVFELLKQGTSLAKCKSCFLVVFLVLLLLDFFSVLPFTLGVLFVLARIYNTQFSSHSGRVTQRGAFATFCAITHSHTIRHTNHNKLEEKAKKNQQIATESSHTGRKPMEGRRHPPAQPKAKTKTKKKPKTKTKATGSANASKFTDVPVKVTDW